MQQALLQQQSLYHPGLLAPPQFFDPRKMMESAASCLSFFSSIYHETSDLLQFVEFADCHPLGSDSSASSCCCWPFLLSGNDSNGMVNYAVRRVASWDLWHPVINMHEQGHYNIFVGNLSAEVTDDMLFACFSVYLSCSDARVMWNQKTGRSRGFGFVSFRNQQDAQSAINDLTGKWLGSRQIRCSRTTKGAGGIEDKQSPDAKSVVELTNGSSEGGKEAINSDASENNPQYTTVYLGNLASEVTQLELRRHFHALGAGVIEEVWVQRDKRFGFVRYGTHAEAALAIQMGNTQSLLCGRQIKCSLGSKPTPPGTSSNPLPPPAAAAPLPGLSTAELLAYE
ncbi:hypothetical protein ACJRO7_005550 [Eucalyptus globulus]|uniref:RRM domain-containing protein n=1 Tax=Eucalyptus globulus TaxID=34317 RepID=A0ABD3J359_EUCGL